MLRRSLLACMALAALPGRANAWPTRAMRLVVPFAAGSGPDGLARVMADELGARLGQPLVVENAPGAGGVIGALALKRAAPDGYTVGLFATNHVINVHTFRTPPYDTVRDFTAIGGLVANDSVLCVAAGSPYRTAADLVAALKGSPRSLTYGSGGKGSIAHLLTEMLLRHTGTRAIHVPFKSAPEIINAMLAGHTDFGMPSLGGAMPFHRNGQLRILAAASATRTPSLPDVPALTEVVGTGPGIGISNWSGLFAPAGLPEPVRQGLFAAVGALQEAPRFTAFCRSIGAQPLRSHSPQEFAQLVAADQERYRQLMRKLDIERS